MKLRRTAAPVPGVLYLARAFSSRWCSSFFCSSARVSCSSRSGGAPAEVSLHALPQRNPRVIAITPPPLSAIYFENEQVTEAELRSKLSALKGRTQTIVIKADKRAFYDQISAVMNIALELGFPVVLASTEQTPSP